MALYLIAFGVVLAGIGSHPPFAYNWENYTLWQGFRFWDHPSLDPLDLTDGLMTDSGRSWWVDLPVWLAFKIAGQSLTTLRIATGAIAAAAAPLTWILARRWIAALLGSGETARRVAVWAAAIAALLLPVLPSWLLYARTATLVGLSLTPALLTVLLIDQLRRLDDWWPFWLVLLQGALLIDAWAYAPIRFLYPLALVFFVAELAFHRWFWRHYVVILGVTLLALPMMLATLSGQPEWRPVGAIETYYDARGEQLFQMRDKPEVFGYYLRDPGLADASTGEQERALVKQNAGDLARLLLDIDTRPAISEYWSQNGRLIPWFLAPFMIFGMALSALRLWRSPEARLLHLLFWGFTLPMILTSRVHIGRLIFAIPFIAIFVGLALGWLLWRIAQVRTDRDFGERVLLWVSPLLAIVVLVPTAAVAWDDYHAPVLMVPSDHLLALRLQAEYDRYQTAGGVVWLSGGWEQLEVESIGIAAARIELGDRYQLVNLASGEHPDPADSRPVLYYGAAANFLANDPLASTLCGLPWLVSPGYSGLDSVPKRCTSADISTLP